MDFDSFVIMIGSLAIGLGAAEGLRRWLRVGRGPIVLAAILASGVSASMFQHHESHYPAGAGGFAAFGFFMALAILYPALVFLAGGFRLLVLTPVQKAAAAAQRQAEERRWKEEQRRKRERENEQLRQRQLEREAQARREELQRKQKAEDDRRRRAARAKAEAHFALYRTEIASRFPRKAFERFVESHLSDAHPPEDVEAHAALVINTIDQHRAAVVGTKRRFKDIEELALWYREEREKIASLPIDDELREIHLVELDRLYSDLSQRVINEQYR